MAKKKVEVEKKKKVEVEKKNEEVEFTTDEKLTVLKTILEQNKKMIELLEKIVARIGG